MEALSNLS